MSKHAVPTILLIDDDEAIRDVLGVILRRHGYRVLEAASGADALATANAHPDPVDVVVSDVVMPGMSGPQAVSQLQRSQPDVQVIYISGYDAPELQRRGVPADATYLQKPVTSQPLLRCLERLLGDRAIESPPAA